MSDYSKFNNPIYIVATKVILKELFINIFPNTQELLQKFG